MKATLTDANAEDANKSKDVDKSKSDVDAFDWAELEESIHEEFAGEGGMEVTEKGEFAAAVDGWDADKPNAEKKPSETTDKPVDKFEHVEEKKDDDVSPRMEALKDEAPDSADAEKVEDAKPTVGNTFLRNFGYGDKKASENALVSRFSAKMQELLQTHEAGDPSAQPESRDSFILNAQSEDTDKSVEPEAPRGKYRHSRCIGDSLDELVLTTFAFVRS